MTKKIIVRWLKQSDTTLQWLIVDDTQPSKLQQGTLQDLAKSAENQSVTLLLPASEVLLLGLALPVKRNSQIKKALPFALEDLLVDEVETYHSVWHKQPDGNVYVALTNHDKFKVCLASFENAGITLDSVYPESLCLPYQEHSCSLLIEHQNAILRTGQWLGGGIDLEVLPIVLDKIRQDNPNLATIQYCSASEPAQWLMELPINLTHHTIDPSLLLMESAVTKLTGELNLLTGDFEQKNTQPVKWKKWLPALAIILITALLQAGLFLNSYWQQKTDLASLETQTLSLFKQTFPEIKRIVNIKVQADQQLIDLQKQSTGKGSPFMQLLYQTGQVLSVNPGFEIRQLDYINDSLQVQLIAPAISQVEQVKQQLESSNQLSVKIQAAEANQKGVEVHYEIKQK